MAREDFKNLKEIVSLRSYTRKVYEGPNYVYNSLSKRYCFNIAHHHYKDISGNFSGVIIYGTHRNPY